MDTQAMLSDLRIEHERIGKMIALLEGNDTQNVVRTASRPARRFNKKPMSSEERERRSQSQKKRWADLKANKHGNV